MNHLRIQAWDVIIVGDGSGGEWNLGAGWASVLVDHYSASRKLFTGGLHPGTVSLGEIFPYLHAMLWYAGKDGPGKTRKHAVAAQGRNVEVHIVTDSQYVATAGSNPGSRKAHRELWAAMDAFSHSGYNLRYHFVEREAVDLNCLVDELSRQARQSLKEIWPQSIKELQRKYPGLPDNATVYDFSPNQ